MPTSNTGGASNQYTERRPEDFTAVWESEPEPEPAEQPEPAASEPEPASELPQPAPEVVTPEPEPEAVSEAASIPVTEVPAEQPAQPPEQRM